MNRAITNFLDVWRTRPVRMASPLDVDDALARLRSGRGIRTLPGHSGPFRWWVVSGGVSADRVRLRATRRALRNSWSPALRARVVTRPGGSELVGSFATPRMVANFTAMWLTAAGTVGAGLLAGTVAVAVEGHWLRALQLLGFTAMVLTGCALVALLVAFGGWSGHGDEQFLRTWLHERLNPGA